MKYVIVTLLTILYSVPALAICEGVDLKALQGKLEAVVADAEFGKEAEKFNADIKGADRLCTVKISQAAANGEKLTAEQEEIKLLFDIISGK